MKLTVNNADQHLRAELSQVCELVNIDDKPNGVFVEWATEGKPFEEQTRLIDICVKNNIPMIVFDRHQNISPDEVSFLLSNGAFLWEPAVGDRPFFSFQPVWGRIIRDFRDLPLVEGGRKIQLGYAGSLVKKIPTFKEYYLPIHEIGEFRVAVIDNEGNRSVCNKVDQMGISVAGSDTKISDIGTTILLGTDHDYQVGRLDPNLFIYLENGVVPLLPHEHRWFHAVFDDLVVGCEDDVEYVLRSHDIIAFGSIYDIYCNLDAYLPECNVKNVAKRIVKYFS